MSNSQVKPGCAAKNKAVSGVHMGFQVGDSFFWFDNGKINDGTIHFIGYLAGEKGLFAGVEFKDAIGRGTGTYKGETLFSVAPGFAAFIQLGELNHTLSSSSPTKPDVSDRRVSFSKEYADNIKNSRIEALNSVRDNIVRVAPQPKVPKNESGSTAETGKTDPINIEIDEAFFESHRIRQEWSTEELVKNVKTVAKKMQWPSEKIKDVICVLEKNKIDGLTLSYEDDSFTSFSKNCNAAYGVKIATIHILKKMKFRQLEKEKL